MLIPIKPAQPNSRHNNTPIISDSNGAAHNEFENNDNQSKRFTSFDSRFTSFPGAVSPSAVCDNRNACCFDEKRFIDSYCLIMNTDFE